MHRLAIPRPSPGRRSALALAVLLAATWAAAAQDKADPPAVAKKANAERDKIQQRLAADPASDCLRVEGFKAQEGVILIEGWSLPRGDTKQEQEAARKAAEARLEKIVQEVTGAKEFKEFRHVLTAETARVPEVVQECRAWIAKREALDGVRIDGGWKFGPRGELLPAGLRPRVADMQQAKALEQEIAQCFKDVLGKLDGEKYRKLVEGLEVSIGQMTEADTRRVLRELQQWARKEREDVRFPRLYFGADGGLKLVCEATTEADFGSAEAKLKELAPELFPAAPKPKGGKLDPEEARGLERPATLRVAAFQPMTAPPAAAVERVTIPSFTQELRRRLSSDPQKRWSAVLIERGGFDPAGWYDLTGVVDNAAQNAELAELIESYAADPKWKPYFVVRRPKDKPLTLDVIPMSALVNRVQRVTPFYPVFDGVQVRGASYDKDANLVLSAHVVGRPNLDEGRVLLAKQIAQHPDFSRRLAGGPKARDTRLKIEVLPPDPVPSDDQLAEFSIGYAASALARGDLDKAKDWIDKGMLHLPGESAVWFLSAYYNHLRGDSELVHRDLYRVIDIEGLLAFNGPLQRKRRYLAAKDLQGPKRDELEKLWLQYFKEARDTPWTMTMVSGK